MALKGNVEDIIKKVTSDKDLAEKFQKDPTKAMEELLGVDLPDDQINQVLEGLKGKIRPDNAKDLLGGLLGKK